jgi:glutaredoxin
MAKAFFQEKGVEYEEYDVAADAARRQEMLNKSGQMGVPVITVGEEGAEQIIIGFDKPALSQALGV